jgi:hypothetical protein
MSKGYTSNTALLSTICLTDDSTKTHLAVLNIAALKFRPNLHDVILPL